MSKTRVLIFTEEYFKATTGMFTVVEQLFQGLSRDEFVVDLVVNFEHWTTRSDIIRLPRLSIAELIRDNTKGVRRKYSLVKAIIFLLTIPFYLFDKIVYLAFLIHFIRKGKYDVVNVHNGGWPAGWVSRVIILSAKFSRSRVYYSIHAVPQNLFVIGKLYFRIVFKLYSIFIRKFVYPSIFLRDIFDSYNKSKSNIIYNAVKISLDKHFDAYSYSSDCLRIGFVGSLSSLKCPDDVIYLVTSEDAKKGIFRVVHFGYIDRDYLIKFKLTEEDLLSLNSFEFNGYTEDRDLVYSSFDILLAPSRRNESFGLVVIEALSRGLPVVCYYGNAYPEIIENSVNGFLYRDFNELNRIIEFYSKNRIVLAAQGERAVRICKQKFGIDQFIQNYSVLYND